MTRMDFAGVEPVGIQSSALASAITGNGSSRQTWRNSLFRSAGKSLAANPGPNKTALPDSGSFMPGRQGRTMADCNWLATGW